MYATKAPDSIFGHFWEARANSAIDTSMTEGIALPAYLRTIAVASKDKGRYKNIGIEACGYMAELALASQKCPKMLSGALVAYIENFSIAFR